MTTSPLSRRPPQASMPTLATILAGVVEDATLTKRQRQDTSSALRTVGRALRRPLDDLPAHPELLRAQLKGFAPTMAGLSVSRWNNALSLTRQALSRAGLIQVPARSRVALAPAWAGLCRLARSIDATPLFGLSRFARYCSDRAIAPETVDNAVFAAFLDDLTRASMSELPRKVQRRAVVAWTRLAGLSPSWPQQSVTIPDYRQTYAIPWSSFPPSLKQDVDAYLHRLAGADILEERDFKPLRPASITTLRQELSSYVSALVHRGHDPRTLRSLQDVVAIPVLKSGLRFFLDRTGEHSTALAHRIALRVTSLARHWVKVDPEHLVALRALRKRLDPGHDGMTEQNRSRLRQFDDPDNVRNLVTLPARLAVEVARCKIPSRAEALLMQTAVAIEILLMNPVRRTNLADLNLERHFIRTRKNVVRLVIPRHEVKNDVGIDSTLPAQTVRLIDLYLERYRPLLLEQPSPWLFPGLADRPKSRERLGRQISETIKRVTGLLVNPHLFRHIAAKLYLKAHPGAYGVIRLLHGHKSVDTTTRFYCGHETDDAFDRYDAHILGLGQCPPPRSLTRPSGRVGSGR